MQMRRYLAALLLPAFLAACGAEPVWAPQELVDSVRYRDPGPARITLITVLNKGSRNGAHSALMINASERVIFDPAGTFAHPTIPERNDVIFGINPVIEATYLDYHARETYDVVVQEVDVSPEVAQMALQRVLSYGAVPKAQCTRATSAVLASLPGFQTMPSVLMPDKLADAFGALPGVRSKLIEDNDDDDNSYVVQGYTPIPN